MNPSTFVERQTVLEAICADPELNGNALKLAMTLMAFVNRQTGKCCPAQRTIEKRCNMVRNTIDTQSRLLEDRKWLKVNRDIGGDRDANSYHFAFDRVREGGDHCGFSLQRGHDDAITDEKFHGSNFEPCSDVHGSNSESFMAQNLTEHGSNFAPELTESNSQNRTQESLFDEGDLPQSPPFDFDPWFEKWWPHYPRRIDKIAAKKLARATIEGRRSDGAKASPADLLAGVMRYAAQMTGKDPKWIQHPTTWLNKGGWMNDYPDHADHRRSASLEAVRAACEEMAARSRRAAG